MYSANSDERLRQQGVAQALIAILGLPATLEAELAADAFRAVHRVGAAPHTGNGADPLADGLEPY